VATAFPSCISLVNYQTGKTLSKQVTEITFSTEVFPLDESSDDLTSVAFSPGISVYHGISDKIDIGIRWEGLLAGSIGAKIQLLGNQSSKFAFALDPRFGGILLADNKFSSYTVVPGIFSFHPNEKFAIMAAEEFLLVPQDDAHSSFSHSLGVEYGNDKTKVVLGATSNYYGLGFFQYGAGLKVRF